MTAVVCNAWFSYLEWWQRTRQSCHPVSIIRAFSSLGTTFSSFFISFSSWASSLVESKLTHERVVSLHSTHTHTRTHRGSKKAPPTKAPTTLWALSLTFVSLFNAFSFFRNFFIFALWLYIFLFSRKKIVEESSENPKVRAWLGARGERERTLMRHTVRQNESEGRTRAWGRRR